MLYPTPGPTALFINFIPGPFLYLGTTYHNFFEHRREEKRRKKLLLNQNEANSWVHYMPFGCRGLLKEEEKRRRLRTWRPHSSRSLRSSGGHSPKPGILPAHVRCRNPPRHIPDFEKNQLSHLRPDLPHSLAIPSALVMSEFESEHNYSEIAIPSGKFSNTNTPGDGIVTELFFNR